MLAIALVMVGTALAPGCRSLPDDGPTICPRLLPAVRTVVVEQTGEQAWLEPMSPPDCGGFAPTAKQMKRFFSRSHRTDASSVHYTLPESPCRASGQVTFADGQTGRWRVDQYRIARLTLSSGTDVILYCASCRFAPFIE